MKRFLIAASGMLAVSAVSAAPAQAQVGFSISMGNGGYGY